MRNDQLMRWTAIGACLAAGLATAAPALADPRGRYRGPRYHHHWAPPPPRYYPPPVRYYPPPPRYHYAPPPMYYPPPAYVAPGFSFGFTVPLR